jgi:hypothetical protein
VPGGAQHQQVLTSRNRGVAGSKSETKVSDTFLFEEKKVTKKTFLFEKKVMIRDRRKQIS